MELVVYETEPSQSKIDRIVSLLQSMGSEKFMLVKKEKNSELTAIFGYKETESINTLNMIQNFINTHNEMIKIELKENQGRPLI